MNGYLVKYRGEFCEDTIWADTSIEARDKAAALLEANDTSEIVVFLVIPEAMMLR